MGLTPNPNATLDSVASAGTLSEGLATLGTLSEGLATLTLSCAMRGLWPALPYTHFFPLILEVTVPLLPEVWQLRRLDHRIPSECSGPTPKLTTALS